MAPPPRFWLLLAAAAIALAGLALGAASQRETFLPENPDAELAGAAGNLVILTALLVGLAVGLAATALSRRPPGATALGATGCAVAAYLVTVLVQSAWPNYIVDDLSRTAPLALTPLINHEAGSASAFVGPMAVLLALVVALGAGLRWLAAHATPLERPRDLLRAHLAAAVVAGPVLAVVVAGGLHVIIAAQRTGVATGTSWLHLVPIAAALVLLAVHVLKARDLAAWNANHRLRRVVAVSWPRLGRVETIAAGALASMLVLGLIMPVARLDALAIGRTWEPALRAHAQFLGAAVLLLAPSLRVHRHVAHALERATAPAGAAATSLPDTTAGNAEEAAAPVDSPVLPVATLAAASALALLGAVAASLIAALQPLEALGDGQTIRESITTSGALWPWLAATIPFAVMAFTMADPWRSAPAPIALAVVLWGIGNTIVGTFDGRATRIDLVIDAELLALWRVAAAVVLAATVVRVLHPAAAQLRPSLRWPLALGAGLGIAGVALLELPFTAWIQQDAFKGELVGIGSVVAAQDTAIQVLMHVLALAGALLAAGLAARILRPEWFMPRRPGATPVYEAVRRPKATPEEA